MLITVVSPSFPRFDATTHYWQAEFASGVAFLRGQFPDAKVVAVPAGLICAPDRVIVRELLEQPDFLVVWSRVWEAPATRKLAQLAGEISPRTRVLVWGDGPLFMPQYFRPRSVRRRRHQRRSGACADGCDPPHVRRPVARAWDARQFGRWLDRDRTRAAGWTRPTGRSPTRASSISTITSSRGSCAASRPTTCRSTSAAGAMWVASGVSIP